MGAKSEIASVIIVCAIIAFFGYALISSKYSIIYESSGTISSTTYTPGGFLQFECTRIRFIATDFTILAYGNHSDLKVGHKYSFTYRYDFNDVADIMNVTEIP
jgi:hypothetical protein